MATMLPELVHQLSQRTVLEAEAIGNFLLRMPFQKHGPQRLVPAVIRLGGVGEELPATGAIHDQSSLKKMSVGFLGQTKENGIVKSRRGRCELSQNPGGNPVATTTALGLSGRPRRRPKGKPTDNSPKKTRENRPRLAKSVSRFPPAEIGAEGRCRAVHDPRALSHRFLDRRRQS